MAIFVYTNFYRLGKNFASFVSEIMIPSTVLLLKSKCIFFTKIKRKTKIQKNKYPCR